MSTFRALKSMFYSAVALFGMWIVVEADIGETTTIIVFTWFILFLIIYATETRELEIASGLADVTLRFFAPANVDVEPVDETDTSDETDETDDPTDR